MDTIEFQALVKTALKDSKEAFGTYHYYDKGPGEVIDIGKIVTAFKTIPITEAVEALIDVHSMKTDLDPSLLVETILHYLDSDDEYNFLFEDEKLMSIVDF